MNSTSSRREFLRTASIAALALGSLPSVLAQDKKIIMAFVGCAHIHTPGFVDLLRNRKDVQVKWVWDHDTARAEKSAKKLGAEVVADVKKVWADPEVVAVVNCAETTRHHDLVVAAAKAGKHMFVEKPLGITAKESDAMANAIERANLLFTTGYFMRADPKHIFLKVEIEKGSFGKITRVRGSNCHSGSLGGWFDTEWRWMADPKIAGVGGFGDLGTHKLDILMWLMGEVDSVTADIKIVTDRYKGCDESGEGLIRFKNGVTGTLAAGWVDVDDPVQLLISGTKAHAVITRDALYYKNEKIPGADGNKPFTNLPKAPAAPLHQFVDAVSGKPNQPLVTPREAADRVRVMEAMYKGARSNKWVKVG